MTKNYASMLPSKLPLFEVWGAAQLACINDTPLTHKDREEGIGRLRQQYKDALRDALVAQDEDQARLNAEFRADMEVEHGFKDMPAPVKAKIHELAWGRGHSYGYYEEVSSCYDGYVELALLALKAGSSDTI
jgi:hypothetical protein